MKRAIHLACVLMWAIGCRPASDPAAAPNVTLEVPPLEAGAPAQPPNGVSFGRPRPVAGARWQVSVNATSQAADQRSEYASTYRVEILETNGAAPSRVRLVFEKNVQRFQGSDKPTSIHGKTYVVDGSRVSDSSGGAAPVEEMERVLDIVPDLGTRSRIDQVLPEAPMQIGDARDELAAAILRVIHPRAWTLGKGTAVLSRVDADEAVFAISLDAFSASSGLHMTVQGDARVRLRDARLTSLSLDGEYDHGSFSLRRVVRDL